MEEKDLTPKILDSNSATTTKNPKRKMYNLRGSHIKLTGKM
jgi:hypothetical protein